MSSLRRRVRVLASGAYRASRRRVWALVGGRILAYGGPLVIAAFIRHLIGRAIAGDETAATTDAIAIGILTAVIYVGWRIASRNNNYLVDAATEYFEREMLTLAAEIPGIEHLEKPEYLDRLEQLTFIPRNLGASSLALIGFIVGLTTQAVFLAVLLSSVTPILLLLPLVAGLNIAITHNARVRERNAFSVTAEDRRVALHFFHLATTPGRADEMRTLRVGHEVIRRHQAAWDRVDRKMRTVELRGTVLTTIAGLLSTAAYVGAVLLVAERGIRGELSPGDVVITILVAGLVNQQLVAFSEAFQVVGRGLQNIDQLIWLIDYSAEHTPPPDAVAPPERLTDGIRLHDVSFRYPGTDRDVLTDVNLHLPAGTTIAVVGDNGAGKTTLVKLLTGMYAPTTGTITLDDTPLDTVDIAAWRARTSAAFQDFARFELTAQHSVGVGDLPAIDDPDRVHDALDRAGARDLPTALDHGLDTPLGASLENGAQVSGGQWQKIALGRAMMRLDPILLVLDEPNASLDPDAEQALFARWAERAERSKTDGAITLLISHRFSTVRIADLIVVLDNHGIREVGTHAELIANQGLYAELYTLQAAAYQ